MHISSFPSSSEAAMVYPSQMMLSARSYSTMSRTSISTTTTSSSPMTAMHQMKVPTGRLRDTTAAPEDATDDTEQPSSPMDMASSPPWVYPSQLWSRSSSTSRSTTGSLSPSEEPATTLPRMGSNDNYDTQDNKNPYSVPNRLRRPWRKCPKPGRP